MKGRYLKRIGGLVLAGLMLSGVAFMSASTAEAQNRRRVVIVRNYPGFYRRFDVFGYDRWGYDRWGYDRFGRDRWGDYRFDSYYRQYVFSNTESASRHGYEQGFKTGKDDGKKAKSFNPERSHYFQEAGFGNFGEVYRTGFSKGYQEGYRVGSNEGAG